MSSTLTLKEIAEYGSLIIIFYVFINYVVSIFNNKNKDEEVKNTLYNNQNKEMFELMKKHLDKSDQNNELYKTQINEIKKLVLNNSNMNTEDFESFMKCTYSNIVLQLEKDMISILDRNHITEATVALTTKKVDNLVEKIINNHIYVIQSLNFDNESIRQIITFNTQEKEQVKSMLKEIIIVYSKSKSEYKKEDAKRQVEENIKYILNAYESHLYSVLKTIHYNL